jgi:hypothetical protein
MSQVVTAVFRDAAEAGQFAAALAAGEVVYRAELGDVYPDGWPYPVSVESVTCGGEPVTAGQHDPRIWVRRRSRGTP